ncbi:MAG: CDP-alcohol phosphatidyltransferase family protein [Clostridia bacterium]|nr:CDP-alcohol phosphatidyltransferase family protein [Clostridia bacterium]
MKLKNIPNLLSVIRICLVFVFVALFFTDHVYGALFVFLLAGATDVVDGYLARKYNWITNLGKILDPFADKLMQCTVLVCLCVKDIIPLWFVIPFFLKEVCTLLIGLIVIRRRSVAVVSKWYGKLTVCLFYATIVLSTVFESFFDAHAVLEVLLFLPAVGFAIFSFAAYIKHYAYLKHEEINKGTLRQMRKEQ